jgi:hypothetical protein
VTPEFPAAFNLRIIRCFNGQDRDGFLASLSFPTRRGLTDAPFRISSVAHVAFMAAENLARDDHGLSACYAEAKTCRL